ncbi:MULTISPECIES: VOC family protein [unclassified Rhizobium]|uniref:VOC family protein n=1 Tax=unclassified Rhizobium TaxID=2613769 RepID=UPI001ADB16C0|nr:MULTISPECIES: VOC family protein [unclassified Rhizobium]MBO9097610.1 VOC family protein [Rhizobium sp. L58/93]MBO9171800.1 VOC family protein [Rhizobium sp. L245/93]MBO9183792.1 VOC family protein [Rhizobium sp. E27B/91]QXZ80429.1 VOC family protein [Rhizobium sp. L51/94]QXZ86468.1 VOC family protein [Rhizobium sp. K1/93]
MTNPAGTPIWYELMTTDADGAQTFYADVVGWSIATSGMEGTRDYRILTAPDGQDVGGLLTLPEGTPMKPGWFCYIGVQDVDGIAEKAKSLGGKVLMGPQDIPGVGRYAMVADPQGMVSYIMRGDSQQASRAFHASTPGHCGWNELVTSDHRAALAFYGELFDWENSETMPMSEMGEYCFIDHAGHRIGAAMTAGAGWPTRWSYYFNVPSIEAAQGRIERGGGTVTMGPHEVPGGMHIIMGNDPQGAAFALVGGK